jgi:hypothetical protein
MNTTELRAAIDSLESDPDKTFAILKQIGIYLADPQTAIAGQELLLRALEKKASFGHAADLLNALVRSAGLFPYLDPEALSLRDAIAFEYHRPENMTEDFVFHREQAHVFRRLMNGDNVILSAPTSFGKSKIIDAVIASGKHQNIAVVVPTLALIDETRRRLSIFRDRYKVITHVTQEPGSRNIFVFTAERTVAYDRFPPVTFFVVDEFYKIDTEGADSTRAVALNQAFYKLRRMGAQFYLLGPSIQSVPDGLQEAYRCYFYPTRYATVASEQIRVGGTGSEIQRLVRLCSDLSEPTLIFCRSPARVNEVAAALVGAGLGAQAEGVDAAADWAANEYHPDWIFGRAIRAGVGIHHGRLPRSLAQYVVRCFNELRLRFLVCTSTLIEGVNTKAKNVIIFDNKIAQIPIDFFTFNNIQGRSGRMFEHFVGHVYLFNEPPTAQLPFVDFPLFTQSELTPESLLIQLDSDDLAPASKERLRSYSEQALLPLEVIRANASIEPDAQLRLAKEIEVRADELNWFLAWTQAPTGPQLAAVCDLIWKHFVAAARSKGGVFSARQLAFKVWQMQRTPDVAARVLQELRPGQFAAKTPDEAVERVLEFERTWASFELPRYLMAVSRIQAAVFGRAGLPIGDYAPFASRIECLFKTPVIAALDEYGIPIQLAEKLQRHLRSAENLDAALEDLRVIDPQRLNIHPFEREVLEDALQSLS